MILKQNVISRFNVNTSKCNFCKIIPKFYIVLSIPNKYQIDFSIQIEKTTKLKTQYDEIGMKWQITNRELLKVLPNEMYICCVLHTRKIIETIERFRWLKPLLGFIEELLLKLFIKMIDCEDFESTQNLKYKKF